MSAIHHGYRVSSVLSKSSFMLMNYLAVFCVKELLSVLSMKLSAVLCMRMVDVAHKIQKFMDSSMLP